MKMIKSRTLICEQSLYDLFAPNTKLNLSQALQSEASPRWCDFSFSYTACLLVLRLTAGKTLAAGL